MRFTESCDGYPRATVIVRHRVDAALLETAALSVLNDRVRAYDDDAAGQFDRELAALTVTHIENAVREALYQGGRGWFEFAHERIHIWMAGVASSDALEARVRALFPQAYEEPR